MKHEIINVIFTIIKYTISIALSWGGILYATNNPYQFKYIGIIVSMLGYGIFFWIILRYEKNTEK